VIVLVARDLIVTSRIAEAAERAGRAILRTDDPSALPNPDSVDLVLVDWGDRQPSWSGALTAWLRESTARRRPRVILFGPHTDLVAHADARAAGLGPMLARSKLVRDLPTLVTARRLTPG
jgi:hypothetical protein